MDVRDIVTGYYLLMKHPESSGEVYNISGEIPLPIRYYVDKLKELSSLTDIKEVIHKPFWREIDIDYQMVRKHDFLDSYVFLMAKTPRQGSTTQKCGLGMHQHLLCSSKAH